PAASASSKVSGWSGVGAGQASVPANGVGDGELTQISCGPAPPAPPPPPAPLAADEATVGGGAATMSSSEQPAIATQARAIAIQVDGRGSFTAARLPELPRSMDLARVSHPDGT